MEIRYYDIIYDAVDDVKAALSAACWRRRRRKASLGLVEVRNVFKISKVGTVAGCW